MYLSSIRIILSVKVEQHVNVKFLAKLGKSATETYNLLMAVYADEPQTMCFEESHFTKKKKARKSKCKLKAMMVFSDIRGIPHTDWVPEG
jgi:hypothetical protein